MCTVLIAWQRVAGWPLIVGNNRDEFFSRRALPPRVYRAPAAPGRRWLASQDLEGGGSWWGWNRHQLMVWLTNRWSDREEDDSGCRSRGRLVVDLLGCSRASAARRKLEELCRRYRFNPFNLVIATPERLFLASNYPALHFVELEPGFHFLGNGRLVDCGSLKAASARRRLAELETGGRLESDRGRDLVLDHFRRALATPLPQDTIPPQGFNVRFADYGTTASLLLARPQAPSDRPLLLYCSGNPLCHPYRDLSRLAALL